MNANELFKAGRLQPAIEAQLQHVRDQPSDKNSRLFLFELSSFAGDLDRAKRQIDAVMYDTPEQQAAVAIYRNALDGETARRATFGQGKMPGFFGEPPAHVTKRVEAVQAWASGRTADAAALLRAADELAPPLKGKYNDRHFDVFRDADDLLGPVLEVFHQGRYFWLPLEQVDSIALNPPKFPRDLLWAPAFISLKDGMSGDALLPAVYPNSHEHLDDAIKLGRATDWVESAEKIVRGVGAKTFLIGDDAVGLLDWREVAFEQ
jgi:type VI secretion system protein ImpE